MTGAPMGAPYAPYDVPRAETLLDAVRVAERMYVNAPMFAWEDGRTACIDELLCRAVRVARWLDAREPPGARVAVAAADPVLWAAAFLGTCLGGRVADLRPAGLCGGVRVLDDAALADASTAGAPGGDALDAFAERGDPQACCCIVSTSGTSGSGKGVMLSQAGLVADALSGMRAYAYPRGWRYLRVLPLSHAFGLVCDLLGPMLSGGCLCVPDSPLAALAQMPRLKVDAANVPPRFAAALLALLDAGSYAGAGTLPKKLLCGGAGLPADVAAGLRAHGVAAYGCYGQSECSPCVSVNRDGWCLDGSAGVPLDCNEVRIARPDGRGAGEIQVRGANVMLGYFDDVCATAAAFEDGWLRTGDVGRLRGGFLFVEGRMDGKVSCDDGFVRPAGAAGLADFFGKRGI